MKIKSHHPSYSQLLKKLPKIEKQFNVDFLTVTDEKFKLVKFTKIISPNFPLLIIMAGCHGEEPAPSLAIFKNYKLISEIAQKNNINLVIYPLVNPWGFNRNKRLNHKSLNCNNNWVHEEDEQIAEEVKIISKDIKKFKPSIFASIHEDDETKKEFYIFSFGDRKYEKTLIKIGGKYFPILQDGKYGDIEVKSGVVYDNHDGSAEDFMLHRGCIFSCCTETPSFQLLSKRIKCNTDIILKLIELSKK